MKKKVDELTKDKMVFKENCSVLQQELDKKVIVNESTFSSPTFDSILSYFPLFNSTFQRPHNVVLMSCVG